MKRSKKATRSKRRPRPAESQLAAMWEKHVKSEFEAHSVESTMTTMTSDPYVHNIPVLTGGYGQDGVREFYGNLFLPGIPADWEIQTISRTIGRDQLVDEMIIRFTHSIKMDWILPRVEPTGRRVEVPLVAIIKFKNGKVAHEHIYWDQGSVLAQVGLVDPERVPVIGSQTAARLLDLSRKGS